MSVANCLVPTVVSVTAGTTAVQISTAGGQITAWLLQNQGTATCYIGNSSVTATAGAGLQLSAGGTVTFDHESRRTEKQVYALANYWVVTAATGNVLVAFYNYDR